MPFVCEVCGTSEQPANEPESAAADSASDHLHVCPSCMEDRQMHASIPPAADPAG